MTATKAPATTAWREVVRRASWDHADIERKRTIDDNPSLDVRMRYDCGQYVIEIRQQVRR